MHIRHDKAPETPFVTNDFGHKVIVISRIFAAGSAIARHYSVCGAHCLFFYRAVFVRNVFYGFSRLFYGYFADFKIYFPDSLFGRPNVDIKPRIGLSLSFLVV